MTYILDRFENDIAVLVSEDGSTVNASREELPPCREGDVIRKTDDGYTVDEEKTAERRSRIKSRFSRLVKRKKKE